MTAATDEAPATRVTGAILGAVLAISFAAPFFRLAEPTHPLVVAGTRLVLAAAIMAVPTWRAWWAGRLPARVVRWGVAAGLLYGLHFGTWVTSLTLTSVASSVTLVTATPLLLAVVAVVRGRDQPSRRHWMAIGLAVVGVTIIGGTDLALSPEALLGDALALAGATAMALYLQLVRELGRDFDVIAFGGLATAVGGAVLLGSAVVTGVPIAFASSMSFVYVALAALIPQLIGHNLLTWSLRHATPTQVGIATVGEPVGSTLLAFWWLGEPLEPGVALGCVVTLTAVLLSVPRRAPSAAQG